MKKFRSCIGLLLALLLVAWPIGMLPISGAEATGMHFLDSVLPDRQYHGSATDNHQTTTAPDPADGMPFPDEGDGRIDNRAERGNRSAARDAATTQPSEQFSLGMAILLVTLSVVSVIIAVVYVFRGRRQNRNE